QFEYQMMQILPQKTHFYSIHSMKEEIMKYWDRFKLITEKSDRISYDDNERTFEAILNSKKKLLLIPDNIHHLFLYRGQSQEYPTLNPTIYRGNRSVIDIFIDRLKFIEFSNLIKKHPVVEKFEKLNFDVN